MKLIPVNPDAGDHVRILYHILALRDSNVNISHRQMPTFEEHEKFVRSKPYEAWYLIDPVGEYVYTEGRMSYEVAGTAYLTHKREIGIFLLPHYQGEGLGYKAVTTLMRMHPGPFYANIAPANVRSQGFFKRLGFGLIQHTYEFQPGDHDAAPNRTE